MINYISSLNIFLDTMYFAYRPLLISVYRGLRNFQFDRTSGVFYFHLCFVKLNVGIILVQS